jgi:hypothetical protein
MSVTIKYHGAEKIFSGDLEQVWLSLYKFFREFLPCFETAEKLMLNVDLQRLVSDSENIIAFVPEGPCLLVPKNKLSDNETLAMLLLSNYMGYRLGITKADSMPRDELQARLGKSAKIVTTRLGELIKSGLVARTTGEQYRITTYGVIQLQKYALPKVKARIRT